MVEVRSPLQGTVVRVARIGQVVAAGAPVAVIESMKMEHTVEAPEAGTVEAVPVLSYDYTVLAGTQGLQNHRKKDRLFEVAERQRLPVVFFTEGGGGRPGDTDGTGVSGLDCLAFHL